MSNDSEHENPTGTPNDPSAEENSSNDQAQDKQQPSQEEVVSQLQQSTESDSGPNETLRRNITLYSRYRPVFKSLAYTIIGASFLPALLAFLVVQLSPAWDLSTLRGAVQRGLSSVVLPLLVTLMLSRATRSGGLAQKHLGWSGELCSAVKVALDVMCYLVLPLRFLYVGLETFDDGNWNDSLGRLVFLVAMAGFTLGLWLTSQRLRYWLDEKETTRPWYASARGLVLLSLPLMPLTLGIMAFAGYFYTAEELSSRAIWTVLLMVGIALVGGLCSRLLLIAQFNIKLRELSRDDEGEIESDETIDISSISGQVNRLIRATAFVGMVVVAWQLWAGVLPAIAVLDNVHLPWKSTVDGATGVDEWITLRHVLIAVGVAVLTFILSSNLPGLLEITLLDRLPLDRGGRYAVSFVVRYLVGIIGIIIAFQMIGFSWNRVQWLAAGLTVGLGFGLQEIFANLVSGIIILVERPVRVGDIVTVNGTTGTVTKMALRATTITDFDYRELIVPNKKFITEDVMNWTLSDNRTRVIIKVGVAYGSDTALVTSTLMKVAQRHPLVLTDPEPVVMFNEFGDNTLNFDLRVIIPTRDIYLKMIHELHMAVDLAFRQKGIEIAFPQRDIFIKNLSDLRRNDRDDDGDEKSEPKPGSTGATGRGGPTRRNGGPHADGEWDEEELDSSIDDDSDVGQTRKRVA